MQSNVLCIRERQAVQATCTSVVCDCAITNTEQLCSHNAMCQCAGCFELVETPGKSCDDPAGLRVSLPGPGYIANLVTEATGCGRIHNPWLIEAEPGQTIRLSLLDFTLAPTSARRRCVAPTSTTTTRLPGGHHDPTVCPSLALVREQVVADGSASDWRNVTLTAKQRSPGTTASSRDNLVYISRAHLVQVAILTSNSVADVPYFMVKYEGRP